MPATPRPARALSDTVAERIGDTKRDAVPTSPSPTTFTLKLSDESRAALTQSQIAAVAEVASQAAAAAVYTLTTDIAAKMIRSSLEATLGELVPKLAAKADIVTLRDMIEQNRTSAADLTRAVGEAVRIAVDGVTAITDVGEYKLDFVRDPLGRVVGAEKTRK
jgi:(p)ppGpp synthase/HD superfamily hydrolase